MSQWIDHILTHFTEDLNLLWVAYDPDGILLDEVFLTALRNRGFELMQYDDPFIFRTEFEDRYRSAWDKGQQGTMPSLVVHLTGSDVNDLPWDIGYCGRSISFGLAKLFPFLAYNIVKQIDSMYLPAIFDAHNNQLQEICGESETKDFILEHVYQLSPRFSIHTDIDFWREILRMHLSKRLLPTILAEYVSNIIHEKKLFLGLTVEKWLVSQNIFFSIIQNSWQKYLSNLGVVFYTNSEYILTFDIPFEHPDLQGTVTTMFLNGLLNPLHVHTVPIDAPNWIKFGLIQDFQIDNTFLQKSIAVALENIPSPTTTYKEWGGFAKQYAHILNRLHDATNNKDSIEFVTDTHNLLNTLQLQSDENLQAWIENKHYADLSNLPFHNGPIMVHRILDYLNWQKSKKDKSKIALLVFDGLALDQWVKIQEHLTKNSKQFYFEEGVSFAWLPTVTSVSRQSIFSGQKPSEFEDSINHTNREEYLWKLYWQEQGFKSNEIIYQRSLHHIDQLDALNISLENINSKIVGLVIDEIDSRLHKESSKQDVAIWISHWLKTGFVERLFTMLLDKGFSIYLTSDHGNVDATGIGRPKEGDIPDTRGERVRIYRNESLMEDSTVNFHNTIKLDIAGLPKNYFPLFATKRTAFVTKSEKVVVHGGISVEELIVPFINISYAHNIGIK